MNREVIIGHRNELAGSGFHVYELFSVLDEFELDPESRTALRAEMAQLADLIAFQEIRVRADALKDCAGRLLALPAPVSRKAFRSWRLTVEGADTSRPAMLMISHRFSSWIENLKPLALETCLDVLPAIATVIGDLKEAGVREILQAIDETESEQGRKVMLETLSAYRATTAPIVLGACRLAAAAVQWGRAAGLKRLVEAVPVSAMEESVHSEKLIPAVAELCDACAAIGSATWTHGFDLALLLAQGNHSAAGSTARKLARRIGRLYGETAQAYLEGLSALVQALGPRAAGFSLNRLPAYYSKYGADRTREFVEAATAVAETCGITAAQWFLEGKTQTARDFFHNYETRENREKC